MIGITKLSSGRLGNRLFHYHFLRQLAAQTGLEYFHLKFPEAPFFVGLEQKRRPSLYPLIFTKKITLTAAQVGRQKPIELLRLITEKNAENYNIILQPPFLGNVFFDYLFFPPQNFIEIKPNYQKEFTFITTNKLVIGLHFRGTDFAAWNARASLKFNYYQKAIEYCLANFPGQKLVFVLFTDDQNFPAYLETSHFLQNNKQEFYQSDNLNLPIIDFYQLSQCDVLISSPSTFAILAGVIGKPKKIIHSQEWLDYMTEQNDPFWVKLRQTDNPYYSLWHAC
ncbi:MAG: hypothetical protein WC863_01315 [Patescibacteria group bacterium]